MKKLIISLVMLTTLPAFSNIWVRVADSNLFYDTKSVKKSGDLTSVDVRSVGVALGVTTLEFDCKRKTIVTREKETYLEEGNTLRLLADEVCRPIWKIWK